MRREGNTRLLLSMVSTFLLAVLGVHLGMGQTPSDQPIVKLDPALDSIVSTDAKIEVMKHGFGFTEGTVWIQKGKIGYLLFSDIPANVIFKMTADGNTSVFMDRSGYTGPWNGFTMQSVGGSFNPNGPFIQVGTDGLGIDNQGRLILCNFGDRNVVRIEKNGSRTVLADSYEGKRLNGPNDVVVKKDGTIYFTETFYGLRNNGNAPNKGLDFQAIFMIKDGKLTPVIKDIPIPNGLALSPDEKYLYANGSSDNFIKRYEVQPDDTVTNGQMLISLADVKGPGMTDGMRVDSKGNIYSSGPTGIWIISPEGKHLGTILTPEPVQNMAFGDADWKTLYIAARKSIYKIRVNTPGIPCPTCSK